MIHEASWIAVLIFAVFVALTLAISFSFAGKTKSSQGYFAAHGEVHWIVNGVAFLDVAIDIELIHTGLAECVKPLGSLYHCSGHRIKTKDGINIGAWIERIATVIDI